MVTCIMEKYKLSTIDSWNLVARNFYESCTCILLSFLEVYVLCCSVFQNRAEVMRKQGKDVSVDVICNGLIALQGKQTLADRCSKISNTSGLLERSRQTVQTQIRLLLKKQSDQGLPCLLF